MQEPLKQKPLSLWEMILGVILYPSEALLEIARQRPWAWAITFIIISVILADVLQVLVAMVSYKSQLSFSIVGTITHIAQALISLAVFTGLVHVIGRQWYYEGDYGGTFCALAFTGVPYTLIVLLSIPIILLFGIRPPRFCLPFLGNCSPTLDPTVGILMVLLFFVTIIWTIILGVIAVRQHYGLTTGGAMITYIIAAVAQGVFSWLLDQLKEVFK
jgi:uncharacterized membrane protein YhaH (DUF805 family)